MSRSNAQGQDQSPFEEDYRGFDVREDEGARGPVILALAIGVLVIFGAVVWNTYRQGVRPEGEGLPSVLAEDTPIRQVPADPGGVVVPHTDKRFYDDMDNSAGAAAAPVTELAGAGETALVAEVAEPLDTGRVPVEPVVELTETQAGGPPVLAAVTTTAAAPVESTTVAEAPQGPRARFAFTSSGEYLVQIAALNSEEAADTAWKRVTAAAPELYYGAGKNIQKADRGAEGVVYRLRVGAFADRSGAKAFCDELTASGAPCFVVKK
jgi:cell division septation protein DedD